jgi:hypothetical protein
MSEVNNIYVIKQQKWVCLFIFIHYLYVIRNCVSDIGISVYKGISNQNHVFYFIDLSYEETLSV